MGGMRRKPVLAKTLYALLVAGVILPVAITIILALAALLAKTGDSVGGAALGYVALAIGILWAVGLVAIVLVQAIDALDRPDEEEK